MSLARWLSCGQDECAEEINGLQAEFEYELQRLQLYLDGEAAFEDAQQERVELALLCALERRLHELLEARLQERITELESALEYARQKLNEKVVEVTWWEDTARFIPQHVPETSLFTFPLDPETTLKLSQVVDL